MELVLGFKSYMDKLSVDNIIIDIIFYIERVVYNMTYIPDCRTDEFYNYDNLTKADKDMIRFGYDWNTEMVIDNFFNNISDWYGDLGELEFVLNKELPERLKAEYKYVSEFENETETRKVETYLELFRMYLLEWIEGERDMLITSIIDGYSDEQIEEIEKKIAEREKENA